MQEFFDPERVVAHPHLSLAGGAIRGWDRRNAQYFQTIQSLARHFHFDLESPWSELAEPVRKLLLYGSGSEEIDFAIEDSRGSAHRKRHAFEGVVPNLDRRFRETDSPAVREELGKFLGTRACPECHGSRLNVAHALGADQRPQSAEFTRLTVGQARE